MQTKLKYKFPSTGIVMDEADAKALASRSASLEKLGISVSPEFARSFNRNAISVALDAGITQPVTTPSNGTPVQFLQEFLPGVVNILTVVRKADQVAPVVTAGEWHFEEIVLMLAQRLPVQFHKTKNVLLLLKVLKSYVMISRLMALILEPVKLTAF